MIYSGKESEVVGLVDVSQAASGMIELLKVSISKHASLVTDFGQDLPAVRGSTGQIEQIVVNHKRVGGAGRRGWSHPCDHPARELGSGGRHLERDAYQRLRREHGKDPGGRDASL
jgi:hypothetical protein